MTTAAPSLAFCAFCNVVVVTDADKVHFATERYTSRICPSCVEGERTGFAGPQHKGTPCGNCGTSLDEQRRLEAYVTTGNPSVGWEEDEWVTCRNCRATNRVRFCNAHEDDICDPVVVQWSPASAADEAVH